MGQHHFLPPFVSFRFKARNFRKGEFHAPCAGAPWHSLGTLRAPDSRGSHFCLRVQALRVTLAEQPIRGMIEGRSFLQPFESFCPPPGRLPLERPDTSLPPWVKMTLGLDSMWLVRSFEEGLTTNLGGRYEVPQKQIDRFIDSQRVQQTHVPIYFLQSAFSPVAMLRFQRSIRLASKASVRPRAHSCPPVWGGKGGNGVGMVSELMKSIDWPPRPVFFQEHIHSCPPFWGGKGDNGVEMVSELIK